MPSFIAAFAIQQLKDMEQLQRDFGRQRTRTWTRLRRGTARVEPVPSPRQVAPPRWHVVPVQPSVQGARADPNGS